MPWLPAPLGAALLSAVIATVVLNEVLYDPPGADGDAEFVELFNAGATPADLTGVELWFVNAGDAADRRRVWTAPDGTTVAAGGFFVVGEAAVEGADATTTLDLQNGPDALWLLRDGATIDAVAWGDDAGVGGEGRAAADPSSRAIGRVPDGRDTQDNAADFQVLDGPTPGRVNVPESALVPVPAGVEPPWRADGGPVVWTPRWIAAGWASTQSGEVVFDARTRRVEIARGDTLAIEVVLELPRGDHVRVHAGAGADTARLRVGALDVRLTEIQARPASGEPEWIELANVGDVDVDLDGWAIGDAVSVRPLAEPGPIAAGARWIVTGDVAAWRAIYGDVAPIRELEGGWPTLNDGTSGDPEAADAVRLFDAAGRLVDRAAYRRDDLGERGESLQRTEVIVDGAVQWMRAAGPPTPGRAHPAESFVSGAAGLEVGPDPFTPDGDGTDDLLQIVLDAPGGDVVVRVFDLFGALVRTLDGAVGPTRGHWQWDGTDARGRPAPVGAYVIHAERSGAGRVERRVVGLARR